MLESTFRVVADHPVTIPALAFAVWVGYRLVKAHRAKVLDAVVALAVVMVVPVFLLLFLAEFSGHPLFHDMTAALVRFESLLVDLGFRVIDAILAAWLQVVLLVLRGIWGVLQGVASSALPALERHEFLLTVFGFEFFAGAVLVYTLYRSSHGSDVDFWLTGGGVVLLVAGLLAGLVQLETGRSGESAMVAAFVAAMLGVALGVTTMLLLVRPNFGGQSVVADLRESEPWSGRADERFRESRVVTALSRLRRSVFRDRRN